MGEKSECHDYYYGEGSTETYNPNKKREEPKWEPKVQEPVEETKKESNEIEDVYGYDWCLDNYDEMECFEYYYGYKWCLDNYDDTECYDYYYPDDFDWNEESNYKWCLNFYKPDDCEERYYAEEKVTQTSAGSGGVTIGSVVAGLVVCSLLGGGGYWFWTKRGGGYAKEDYDDELL